MSHGKAPRPSNQGSPAAVHTAAPATSGKPTNVHFTTSTPDLSSSRGVHVPPIGGKGTIGKPGATPKPHAL